MRHKPRDTQIWFKLFEGEETQSWWVGLFSQWQTIDVGCDRQAFRFNPGQPWAIHVVQRAMGLCLCLAGDDKKLEFLVFTLDLPWRSENVKRLGLASLVDFQYPAGI